jgi:hypothetical protein
MAKMAASVDPCHNHHHVKAASKQVGTCARPFGRLVVNLLITPIDKLYL